MGADRCVEWMKSTLHLFVRRKATAGHLHGPLNCVIFGKHINCTVFVIVIFFTLIII